MILVRHGRQRFTRAPRVVAAGVLVTSALAAILLRSTAGSAGLEVKVLSWTQWNDAFNVINIVGEVQNTGTANAELIGVGCNLFGPPPANQRLGSGPESRFILTDRLAPTEKSPFLVPLQPPPPGFDHAVCAVTSATATPVPPNHKKLVVVPACTQPADCPTTIAGTVTNQNTVAANRVKVLATFYDARRNVIDEAHAFLTADSLASRGQTGSSASFELVRSRPTPPTWARVEVFAESPSPPSLPAVTLSLFSLAFGKQLKGTTSTAQRIRVTNTGNDDLHLSGVSVVGANPDDFLVLKDPCFAPAVGPDQGCDIVVSFKPLVIGDRSAILRIVDDATDSPQTVLMKGTGAIPTATLSRSAIDFGEQTVNTSSLLEITITNNGTIELHVGSLSIDGVNHADFTESDSCKAAVGPGRACIVSIAFKPAATGARRARMTTSDEAQDSPQVVTFTGTGTAPVALTSGNGAFGDQPVGKSSPARSFAVANTSGIGHLHVSSVTLAGANPGDFVKGADSCSGKAVDENKSCTIELSFEPGAPGDRGATLRITDDAVAAGVQTISLSGRGVAPAAVLGATAVGFGDQPVGRTSGAQAVTLINSGNADLHVLSVSVTGPNASDFMPTDGCSGQTVLPSGPPCSVSVAFRPAATGGRRATLSIVHDAVGSPQTVALTGVGTVGGQFHPLPPTRLVDTRPGESKILPFSAPLGPGETIRVQVTGGFSPVPSEAAAVVLNATVTNTTARSFLTLFPADVLQPLASNLNWVPGQTVPNLVEVKLSPLGQIAVFNMFGSVDVILDVAGWVSRDDGNVGTGGFLNPLPPRRILDTRAPADQPALGIGQTRRLQVAGQGGVPAAGVSAVVLNVTVTNGSASSHLTVFPTEAARPTASNLNWGPGLTVANRVIVKVGPDGSINLFNFQGSVDGVVDVGGWFSADGSDPAALGAGFTGITPIRIADTRPETRKGTDATLGPRGTIRVQVAGVAGLPDIASKAPPKAVVLNVTVTRPTARGFLTVFPGDVSQLPLASDLNWVPDQTVPNLVIVKLGADGSISVFNSAGTTDVVIDVVGWYG